MAKEHADVLRQALEQMISTRRTLATELAKPPNRHTIPQARLQFIEVQQVIEAIERAMEHEDRESQESVYEALGQPDDDGD